eukprot:107375-Chlamydomonas_euryale.AAC.1
MVIWPRMCDHAHTRCSWTRAYYALEMRMRFSSMTLPWVCLAKATTAIARACVPWCGYPHGKA